MISRPEHTTDERCAWLEAAIQAAIDAIDAPDGDEDFWPMNGAPEPTAAGNLDQRRWSQGGDCDEREQVSEDEGVPAYL